MTQVATRLQFVCGPGLPRVALAAWLALLAAGCAGGVRAPADSTTQRPADPLLADMALSGPAAEKGRIVFYRPPEALLVAVQPRILVNGKSVGPIVMGAAFYRDALPGFYRVHLEHEDEEALLVEAARGEIVFLRTRLFWETLGYKLRMERVDAETGANEAAVLRWQPPAEEDAPLTYRRDGLPAAAE
jgi:hypothetical protein